MHLLKHHVLFFLFDWEPTLQNLAAASFRKLKRKPNLAAESVRASLSKNVRSSGRRYFNDKRREGGCLLIENVIMSPPFF